MKASRVMVLAAAIAASLAHAQGGAPAFVPSNLTDEGVRALASGCAMCHGAEGRPVPGSTFPALAGRPAAGFVTAMNDFIQGRRAPTVMQQIARGYDEAEIAALARYFEKRAR